MRRSCWTKRGRCIRVSAPTAAIVMIALLSTAVGAAADTEELVARLGQASGKARVDLLNELSKARWGISTEETLAYAEQARLEARDIAYPAGEACALHYAGIGRSYQDDYDSALELCLEALEIYERIEDDPGIAACRSTIGTIYLNIERFEEALATYLGALAIAEEIGDRNRAGIVVSNIGTTYLGLEKPAEALEFFSRALEILEEQGSQLDILTALGNIGGAYRRLERYEESLEVNSRIIEIATDIDSRVRLADALTDTGQVHFLMGNHNLAFDYVRRAIELATRAGLKRNIHEAEIVMVEILEARGEYRSALEHHKRYTDVRNSIFSEESAQTITEMQVKYETEKKEREIQTQRLELERQRNTRNNLVGVSLLVLVLALTNFWRLRAKQRENDLLERLSRTDSLTGLANRRALLEALELEYRRRRRGSREFSLVLCDIDRFKRFNDTYGHDIGDLVLTRVAAAVKSSVREVDTAARWGGEEFLALLPECSSAEALMIAERIQQCVRDVRLEHEGASLQVTATFGVSTLADDETIEECLKRADLGLYDGKEQGRDRICCREE